MHAYISKKILDFGENWPGRATRNKDFFWLGLIQNIPPNIFLPVISILMMDWEKITTFSETRSFCLSDTLRGQLKKAWRKTKLSTHLQSAPTGIHYCSRNIWATYGLHMGHIWGPGLQHMELFQHMGKKILQKANIWATYGSLFQTYGVLLKHIGPFWNTWGLSETYGAFRERSLFLFPTCHIALFRYMSFFSLSKVLPITNQACSRYFCKKKRLLEVVL